MKKVIIYIAMSLDGYIADKNGGVAFLGGDGTDTEDMGSYNDFYDTVSEVIMGYTTYNQIVTELAPDNYPYSGRKSYVLTTKNLVDKDDIIFTKKSIPEIISELKTSESKGNIWINGGASIVNQVLKFGLFDEIVVSVIPTILGSGINLFQTMDTQIRLKLVSTQSYNGIVELKYVPNIEVLN
ncbi:riboflavin biosynthesis protein RibD [Candidatus Epulonipiscium fishelsonii]|uniref:Riboflavin biosynthesis protein RibD n=1 Tax=Candidatus Epulonipiscium fishelsonii TaxID=77094 RepID=A0ACC8XCF8_9FIRM|nr:riboflavin biosynthesis protein RibD [Epulopiscium sp. SCG-B11WGA-EpuloA1]ONI41372.1 riboflavin biosynthesis protein RibD [Epulopiscium sp. SCG-B05WGA-EpuloA1]